MSAISAKPPVATSLYERDYCLWAQEQADALRERRPDLIDWANLAEEVEDLAGRYADALESHCKILVEHLPETANAVESVRRNNLRLWRISVRNARYEIRLLLRRNPSLRARCDELFADAWPVARNIALAKLDLDDEAIPEAPSFTFEQAVDENFDPELRHPSR